MLKPEAQPNCTKVPKNQNSLTSSARKWNAIFVTQRRGLNTPDLIFVYTRRRPLQNTPMSRPEQPDLHAKETWS